jgi:hypothetical protein
MEDGLEMLQDLLAQQIFSDSHILIRVAGTHSNTCPGSLPDGVLKDKTPRTIIENSSMTQKMYKIQTDEWKPLLQKMLDTNADCNFWFINP